MRYNNSKRIIYKLSQVLRIIEYDIYIIKYIKVMDYNNLYKFNYLYFIVSYSYLIFTLLLFIYNIPVYNYMRN